MVEGLIAVIMVAAVLALLAHVLMVETSTDEPRRCHRCAQERPATWVVAAVCDPCIDEFDEVVRVDKPTGR